MSFFRKGADTVPAPVAVAPPATGISLVKGGTSSISMVKTDPGVFVSAHLDWDGGSAGRRAKGADLELYVLYVGAADVTPKGIRNEGKAVYYKDLGWSDRLPFIKHHGDSLTPGRESATIDHPDRQGYALICAYSAVGNGVGSFKSYGAHTVISDGRHQTVNVPLYDDNPNAYWVAIALVDFTGDGVSIQQVERYSARGSEARPVLYSDGTFAMDAGPVEFKG